MADPYDYIGKTDRELLAEVLRLQQRMLNQMGTLAQDVLAVKADADAIQAIQVPMSANVAAVLALLQANNVPAAQALLETTDSELKAVAAAFGTSEAALVNQLTPVVGSIAPATGSIGGGTVIAIVGAGFTGATLVNFTPVGGGASPTPGSALTITDDSHMSITAPALSPGVYDVQVTNSNGTSAITAADQYTAA